MYYIGTQPEESAFDKLLENIAKGAAVESLVTERTPLEVTVRKSGEDTFYFLMNFSREEAVAPKMFGGMKNLLTGKAVEEQEILKPYDVMILG